MDSITLTLSGNSSSLYTSYYPEIQLDENSNYACALIDFNTYNSIPNITNHNNHFNIIDSSNGLHEIIIPEGAYEIDEIIEILEMKLKDYRIRFRIDKKSMKCGIILRNCMVDFTPRNSIGHILGFMSRIIGEDINKVQKGEKDKKDEVLSAIYWSDHIIDIKHVNVLRVDCNIATGSYINNKPSHTIHEFYPEVQSGYKIVEVPKNLIYLPIVGQRISQLNIKIVDEKGDLVDFRGETITVRIHIKKSLK